ncbi:amino acid permease [Caldifermentibacillus hisashii]|uniref:amino acid permease n=1 Tax=Bacillaceae TaxID=186817 RepID=UPI001C128B35|nr:MULTISPECIES: amino acid permease [Bacillaceae]MBU5343116.1 amino acid permease [Caldifermentibacillus hisashii]MCM3477028.1 amino acid permease [Caldibacillus thermoamylovorans]
MNKEEKKLKWWQLSILGTGFIIGTGFFLGSNIAIKAAGPAVLVTFLLAAIGTYIVYDVLSRMTADDPQSGSFSYYSKKAFGNWAGFASGWVYWSSEMLIMGSQLTGISIFTKFWFPEVPIWIFASIYTVLGIIVVLVGVKWFERLGNLFAIAKLSAIVMFIILAILGLFGVLDRGGGRTYFPNSLTTFLPAGLKGVWAALLFSFYAFGGIEIMSIYATRLENAKDAPKSGKVMLVLLTTIYLVSIGMSVILVQLSKFTMDDSPFVVALDGFRLAFIPHLFTAILVIAGFSTMSASLYAVTTLLISLSKEGYAPKKLSKKGKLKVPFPALVLTTGGLIVSIVLGFLLPNSVYEYITTAAGLMLLYNWVFILYSGKRLLTLTRVDQIKRIIATVLILSAVTGSLIYHSSRPGFYISIGFLFVIGIVTVIMNRRFKGAKEEGQRTKQTGLFERLENI